MVVRFWTLVGVSTVEQAQDDKASIPDQIDTCRRVIKQLDGVEVGLSVMDGFSRTGYDSLADAMNDIPPLKQAIEAAERNLYDVLILDNFDRVGDLGILLNTRFKRYKKQLYSARQSGRLQDPSSYDPKLDESSTLNMYLQGIIQSYRIGKLQRGLELGVARRVEDGKYSRNFPYGWSKSNEWNPTVAALLIRMKDEFLRGATLSDLERLGNESGVPSSSGGKWQHSSISILLKNPFYAGKVFKGRYEQARRVTSKRGKKISIMKKGTNPQYYPGKQPPLWTWDEHLQIMAEFEQRYKKMPRHDIKVFSGLLVCGVCDKRLYFQYGNYKCPTHFKIPSDEANREIGKALADALRNYSDESKDTAQGVDPDAAIAAINKQIAKVQDLALKDIFSATEARDKVAEYRRQIEFIESNRQDDAQREAAHRRILATRDRLTSHFDDFPRAFADNPPEESNRFLRDIVREIRVEKGGKYLFIWR